MTDDLIELYYTELNYMYFENIPIFQTEGYFENPLHNFLKNGFPVLRQKPTQSSA